MWEPYPHKRPRAWRFWERAADVAFAVSVHVNKIYLPPVLWMSTQRVQRFCERRMMHVIQRTFREMEARQGGCDGPDPLEADT